MAGQLFTLCFLSINISLTLSAWASWPGAQVDLDGIDIFIETQSGLLKGKRRNIIREAEAAENVEKVDCFLGIPYAEPPIGKLRFKAPVSKGRWGGIRNATRYGSVCPQGSKIPVLPTAEDCLTLNVYVPYKSSGSATLMPVMVYIHGGSYRVGTANTFPGTPLAQRGIILVTINYRLDALGFISARNKYLTGNNGLLDQMEALRWVQKNIIFFGGDSTKVTVFGNSAGASSVGILMVSPLAKGLFQQSIVQSGSPFSFWAMHNNSINLATHARTVAEKFQCTEILWTDLADCLREVSPDDFLKVKVTISVSHTDYRPHVDGIVIPRDIDNLYQNGHINPQRVMVGVVGNEYVNHMGSLLHDLGKNKKDQLDPDFRDGIRRPSFKEAVFDVFQRQFGWGESVPNVIIHEYTNWTHQQDDIANRKSYVDLMSDFAIVAPTVSLAQKTRNRGVPVYLYKFNHKSVEDVPQWASNAHQMELFYVFGAPFVGYDVITGQEKSFSELDKTMSRYMISLWTDFAKYGDPSFSTSQIATWDEMSINSTNHLSIDLNDIKMVSHLNAKAVSFWNELIPTLIEAKRAMDKTIANRRALPTTIGVYIPVNFVLVAICIAFGAVICTLVICFFKSKSRDSS